MEKTDAEFLRELRLSGASSISAKRATRYAFGGGGSSPTVTPAAAPPTQIKAAEVVAENRKIAAERKRRGFASTQLTTPGGVQNAAPAAKALLGG